ATGNRLSALHYARAGEFDFARAVDAVDPASRTETFRRTLERAVCSLFISTRNASRLRERSHGRARCRSMGAGDLALRSISATRRPRILRPRFRSGLYPRWIRESAKFAADRRRGAVRVAVQWRSFRSTDCKKPAARFK